METERLAREVLEAVENIRAIYERKGRPFSDMTLQQFFGAFKRIPVQFIRDVVEELVLNPPDNFNYVPEPSDVLKVARRFTEAGQVTALDVVAEITQAINAHGVNGRCVVGEHQGKIVVRYEAGSPPLSIVAALAVESMGGWVALCTMQAPDGVWQAQVRGHAEAILERRRNAPVTGLNKIGASGTLEKIGGRQ